MAIFFATNEAKIKILLDIAVLQQQYQATFQTKKIVDSKVVGG